MAELNKIIAENATDIEQINDQKENLESLTEDF